jgi:hypothetical protein
MTTTDDTLTRQAPAERPRADWMSAWPDVLAFVGTLAMAWWGRWSATDLVWSLWLSSLVVGYSIIVWSIARPIVEIGRGAWRDRASVPPAAALLLASLMLVGGLFLLAFFTVHFGGFHYVHSQFLASFFPVDAGDAAHHRGAGMATYVTVARRYWRFLPAAFLAERGAFIGRTPFFSPARMTAANGAGGTGQRRRLLAGGAMWEPYRNVVRMHVLIFFFFFAHFIRLDNFLVYAVVYAVYFFPWRLVRRESSESSGTAAVV